MSESCGLNDDTICEALAVLRCCKGLTVFAGAGLSAESGIPTFRDNGGLWENHCVEDVATPDGFRRDPLLVWKFYAQRQQRLEEVKPNAGHYALAQMETIYSDFLLVTQNVDDLSERAGSVKMVKIHGDLMDIWCSRCQWKSRLPGPINPNTLTNRDCIPKCPECGNLARPGVVWFGEFLPEGVLEKAWVSCSRSQALLIVGTSGAVSGGYGIAERMRYHGGQVIEINPDETCLTPLANICLRGSSASILPQLVSSLQNK